MVYFAPSQALSRIVRASTAPLRETIGEALRAQVYPLGYVAALDGMRGLMTLGVVAAHVTYRTVPGTVLYIDLFFAASAYYITGLLLRDIDRLGHIDFYQFYQRRFGVSLDPGTELAGLLGSKSGIFQLALNVARCRPDASGVG